MKSKILKYILISIGILFMLSIPPAFRFYKVSGSNPPSQKQNYFRSLNNYADEQFQNINSVKMNLSSISITEVIKDYINRPKTITPSKPIPHLKSDLKKSNYEIPTIIWFGHSSYLVKYKKYNILVDPVFSPNASPFSLFVKAFDGTSIYNIEELPKIDLLIITHDHYDHLDYNTIIQLKDKVKQVITPLGVSSHLLYWGYDTTKVKELNWYESQQLSDFMQITATPSQHFSGRSITRNKTLWASYVLELDTFKLFLGCDGGYSTTFKKIGDKFGPFDLALLENGQYNQKWHAIHCFPEETAQIGIDLKAKMIMPIHWAKFTLAFHPWNEPVKRLIKSADKLKLPITIPKIGEEYILGTPAKRNPWWNFD
jgi:L-ascorbate metabolism protein UlaG (beta-lactamase superfamily)